MSDEIKILRKCTQANCKVHEDGKCLEDLKLSVCPHFNRGEALNVVKVSEESQTYVKENVLKPRNTTKLYSSEELNISQTSLITNNHLTKLIFIVGESGTGKTTILAEIFNSFQLGLFSKFQFAGSLTQIGFERRCHLSRINSKSESPVTDKTRSKEFNFLHLCVRSTTNNKKHHLLLSDIAGERFQRARDSSTAMKELGLMNRSKEIYYLIDGKRLADKTERNSIIANNNSFIQQAIDDAIFTKETVLKIYFSKWDLLVKAGLNLENLIISQMKKDFSDKIKGIEFYYMATRPDSNEELENLFEIESFLEFWTRDDSNETKSRLEFENGNRLFHNYTVDERD